MATTMRPLGKVILGADAANIEFTSIPGNMSDLLLIAMLRTDRTGANGDSVKIRVNGATSDTNHTVRYLYASNTTVLSFDDAFLGISGTAATAAANTFASNEVYIPNYAGSATKTMSITAVSEDNVAATGLIAAAGRWNSTDAITSIRLMAVYGTNLKSGSSAYLYGITKA